MMQPPSNRRTFLQQAAVLSTAAAFAPRAASAIEPIARPGAAKFKFSMAAYSYRGLLNSKELTLADFIDDCARMGLEWTELTSYYFPKSITHEYLRSLKRQCFRLGLDVSGTAVRNDFGHPEGRRRRQQIETVKRWIDYAEILGAPVIRIFAGHAKGNLSSAQSHSLMVAGMEECCEYAGQHRVHLALENHGGPTATADGLLALVRDVKSPWFGLNMDTGNFHSNDIYADLQRIAPYAVNVQVKVVVSGPDGKKRPSDFKRLAKILREAHYRGYVVLEFEEAGDPRKECPGYIDQMRQAFV